MKKIATQINHLQLIPQRHYTLLLILLIIILTGTLVNSQLFISSSLAAYFLYATFASIFIAVVGILVLTGSKQYQFDFPLPAFFFLFWAGYVVVHGLLVSAAFTLWHYYIIISCLFFISLSVANRLIPSISHKLFSIISLLAAIESLVCVFQYAGWIAGNNSFFTVTGTWINPNITATFLAMACPAVLSLIFTTKDFLRKMAAVTLVLLTIALFLLKCRTAFAGAITASAIVLNAKFHWLQWLKSQKNIFLKVVLLLAITATLLTVCFYAYQFKKASADGRKLVWKLSMGMIAAKPFTGYGYGMFEREYNLTQAAYFKSGQGSAQEKVEAGYVHMAYNEFLQNSVEGGVPGMLLFAGILASLLVPPLINTKETNKTGAAITTVINKNGATSVISSSITNKALTVPTAYAGLVAFALMCVLNFTLQATPVWCVFIIYASLVSVLYSEKLHTKSCYLFLLPLSIKSRDISKQGKLLWGSFLTIAGMCFFFFEGSLGSAHLQMRKVAQLTDDGNYKRATQKLKTTEDVLDHSEIYWQSYGRISFGQKDYTTALAMFNKVKGFTSNPELFIQTGNCYEIMGRYQEAEKDYLTAASIEPSRLAPRFALMTIYQKIGDTLQAMNEAKEIMASQPKVASLKAQQYKSQAAGVLHQLQTNRLLLLAK
jgi:O-antigen polymerase